MRPRLRDDVRYVKCPDGVYVSGHAGACVLKGGQMYEWLSRIAPHLTGESSLEDLTGAMSAERRVMVKDLVAALAAQRFVVDARQDEPHALGAEEQRIYEAEIAFIRYALDSAERRFQRLRDARIVLIGEGPVLEAVVRAGLWSGWRQLRVLSSAAAGAGDAALAGVVDAARRDARQQVRVERWNPADREQVSAQADVVLHLSRESAELVEAARACSRAGTALGQVLVGAGEAWLTPVDVPDRVEAPSCWRRLAAHRLPPPGAGEDLMTGPVPAIVAAQLALSCFSHLTGLDTLPRSAGEPEPPYVTRIDLRTLDTGIHRVRPARFVSARAVFEPVAPSSAHEAPLDAGHLLRRAAALIDKRTGVIGLLNEGDLPQIPLSVCGAVVSDPLGALPECAPLPTVTGWGRERPAARLRTLLAALATYGSLTAPAGESVMGLDLISGRQRGIEVPAVDRGRVPYQAPVGVAAGLSFAAAVAAGLSAHCAALLAPDATHAPFADPRALAGESASGEAGRLLELLAAAEQKVVLRDLSGLLDVPAFAFYLGSQLTALTCAATAAEALTQGLERTLLRWQLGARLGEGPVCAGQDADYLVLAKALHRSGRIPCVVSLATDPEVSAVVPHVVQVVLCDE